MQKNVAGQKYTVFAFDATDGSPKTGDAFNITANLRRDGVQDAIADTNPTETERGQYEFDLEQGETDGDYISIAPNSTTANIEVVGMPMGLWTTAPNINVLTIANGRIDVGKWLGSAVTLSTGNQPDVNVDRIDDVVVSGIATDGKLHVLDDAGTAISTAAKLRAYIRLALRSDTGPTTDQSTELTEINADDGAGAGDYSSQADSQENISDKINALGGGAGAITWPHTVTDEITGNPIADCDVWVSTDAAGSNVIAGSLKTDQNGVVTFFLDAGTIYVWRQKSGQDFVPNPVTEVVS